MLYSCIGAKRAYVLDKRIRSATGAHVYKKYDRGTPVVVHVNKSVPGLTVTGVSSVSRILCACKCSHWAAPAQQLGLWASQRGNEGGQNNASSFFLPDSSTVQNFTVTSLSSLYANCPIHRCKRWIMLNTCSGYTSSVCVDMRTQPRWSDSG